MHSFRCIDKASPPSGQSLRPTNRRAAMDNARSRSQISVERQISVKDDTVNSDFCNNTAGAQPCTPKIQAVGLQNHYAETLWNKQNVTSQV